MLKRNKATRLVIYCFSLLILSGCSKISPDEVNKQYYEGNAKKAYELAQKGANELERGKTPKGDELLWQIQSGIIGFDLGDQNAANLLEIAEENINQNELEGIISSFFKNTEAILINDNVIPYKGFLYEGVMVNYYKALLYMSEKKYADARVEFNRASDRQRRLKEYYQEEIAKTKEAQSKATNNKENDPNKQNQKEQQDIILQTYTNLEEFSHLNDHINPAVDYVAGIFFMLQGDYSKAQDFLKESYGITQSSFIAQDLQSAQNKSLKEKQTWIIIEDGKSPFKIEKRFSFPIFTGDGLIYVSLALPDIKKGVDFASSYTLYDSSNVQQAQATQIATLNPLAFNEFKKQLPFIITRAIISTTIKALSQYVVLKSTEGNGVAQIIAGLGGIFTQATTQADLRIATIMPNSFYVLRIANTEGKFNLKANGKMIASIDISAKCAKNQKQICVDKNNIVYIRNAQKNTFKRVLFSQ